jgi:hypothetical protein
MSAEPGEESGSRTIEITGFASGTFVWWYYCVPGFQSKVTRVLIWVYWGIGSLANSLPTILRFPLANLFIVS